MRQARADDALDVRLGHLLAPLVRHERLGGAGHDDVTAKTVDVDERAHAGDLDRQIAIHRHLGKNLLRGENLRPERVRLLLLGRDERLGIVLVGDAVLHQLHALLLVEDGADGARGAEAIEQLGAQLALLGVARSNHDELRGVRDGDTLALHGVPPARGGIEHDVHERVVEEVHLIDVEKATVGTREKTRVVRLHALRERLLDVDGTADAILGGA